MSEIEPGLDKFITWLEQDEAKSRIYRASRLQLLVKEYGSEGEGKIFFGGPVSAWAFQESRLAYLNGLFLACIVLCQICLEYTLSTLLHLEEQGEVQGSRYQTLLRQALDHRFITTEEFALFDELRKQRNPYVHFRTPTDHDSVLQRSAQLDTPSEDLLVEDAERAIVGLLRMFQRHPFTIE